MMRSFSEWIVEREIDLEEQMFFIEAELGEKGKSQTLAKRVGMMLMGIGIGIWANLGAGAYDDYLAKYTAGEYGQPNTEILDQLHHKAELVHQAEKQAEASPEQEQNPMLEEPPVEAGSVMQGGCPTGGGRRTGPIKRIIGKFLGGHCH